MKHTLLVLATWIAMASFAQNENSITDNNYFQRHFKKSSLEDINTLMADRSFVKQTAATTNLPYKAFKAQWYMEVDLYISDDKNEELYVLAGYWEDLYEASVFIVEDLIPDNIKDYSFNTSKFHYYYSYLEDGVHRSYLVKYCCY